MVVQSKLLVAALRYADLGYRVFPCVPGGKPPITNHGFHDATNDPEQIERWWTQHPNANIGIPTEGLIVIDIDDNNITWPDNYEKTLTLAGAPMSVTPRGGVHRIFRQPAEKSWRNTESRLAPRVDTRANGGYIIAPPSIVDGKSYRWAPGYELDVPPNRLPEPPPWLVADLDCLGDKAIAPHVNINIETNGIPKGQRNATLARLAGAMRRVGMSQTEIAAALHQANKDRCTPSLSPHEVDRIAASIARYAPDEVSVALVEDQYQQMQEDQAADDTAEPESPTCDSEPIPDELLYVPGFVDEVMRYTLDTAPYPERVLAFAGALSLQALLAGRKVRDLMDNRTNLYILGLANSGAGKEHPRKINTRILHEVGLSSCLGTSFASGEGIEDRLYLHPATLFQVDELDGLMSRINQARDARYEQIISILLQMYSSASSIYVMRAKAGQDRATIDQPCLCLFGTAVPKHFYGSLSSRFMTNGFLARLFILECRSRGSGQDNTDRPIPTSILEAAHWWADFRPGESGNLAEWHPAPQCVSQSDDATIVFRGIRERADAEYTLCEKDNDPVGMAIWARVYEKARRLALIYSVSLNRHNPIITNEAATWAGLFAEHQTRRMLSMVRLHVSENDFDARCKRLLEILIQWQQQHGDIWMPFWKINRRLPWTPQVHGEVREALTKQKLIEVTAEKKGIKGGRPGFLYRLIK